ncbi:MAG: hypothetical protein ACRBBW_04400 [Cellvibrionaceae bacterium]
MKKSTKKNDDDLTQQPKTEDDLSTIREILFGQQHRQHNQAQTDLEALIKTTVSDLKQDTKQQFKELNKKVDDLNNSLSKRLDKEIATEVKARDKAVDGINAHLAQVEDSIAKLDASTTTADNDLQDQLLNQADAVQKQMDELYNEVTTALKQEVERLSHDKADRTSLATLLNGIASQLSETGQNSGIASN